METTIYLVVGLIILSLAFLLFSCKFEKRENQSCCGGKCQGNCSNCKCKQKKEPVKEDHANQSVEEDVASQIVKEEDIFKPKCDNCQCGK